MRTVKRNNYLMAWLICGLGALYYSYEYLLRISPSVMEIPLREHFNLSASGFGLLSAFYYYAYLPMQLPVGILLDRYGPRRLLTLACLLCVIGTLLFANTQIFIVAAIGRFLVGFGSAFAFVGVLKLATIWLPENKLALVSGLASALGTIGAMIGDNLLGTLVVRSGWRLTVDVTAYVGIFLTILLWLGLKDTPKVHQISQGTIATFKKSLSDLSLIIKNKQIWINGLYGCLVYLPTTVFAELWGIPYLKNAHGLSTNAADFANSLLFLGFTIGAPLLGYISDKLKRRKPPMFVGALGALLMICILLYVPSLNAYVINTVMFILGACYSAECIVFAVGRELSPNEAGGTAMAMTNMLVMLGAMLIQPFVGALLDWRLASRMAALPVDKLSVETLTRFYSASDYQFALSIIPIGILMAIILTFFLKETYAYSK